jgi:predicted CoA-binding protein
MNVTVLGASNESERFSCQAVKLLAEKGHAVFPVHPAKSPADFTRKESNMPTYEYECESCGHR